MAYGTLCNRNTQTTLSFLRQSLVPKSVFRKVGRFCEFFHPSAWSGKAINPMGAVTGISLGLTDNFSPFGEMTSTV
jgi:hypothetical protein